MLSFYGWICLLGGLAPGLFLSQTWLVMSGQRARSRGQSDQAERANLWFLWLAFAYALVVYGFVGDLVRQQGRLLPIPVPLPLLTVLLVVLGIGSTALAFWQRFATQIKDYQTYAIIRSACAESIGIYGLVLYLRGSSWTTFGIFLAWAFFLLLIVRPTAQSQRQFREWVAPTGKVLTGRLGWTLASAAIFVLLAIGLGIFLKRTRGFSTINAVLCALFFAVMLLAPLVPMLRQGFKARANGQPWIVSTGFTVTSKRFFASMGFAVALPIVLGVATLFFGPLPEWVLIAGLAGFVAGATLIFRRRNDGR